MQTEIGQAFTPKERNAVIRYALSVGTRAKCATRWLLRPLKMRDLQAAIREREAGHRNTIETYTRRAAEYRAGKTPLSAEALSYFEGVPSEERFTAYCNGVIRQEREILRRCRREYQISVDCAFTPKKWLRFHKSLSPRVTFGYSSALHEECDFALTDEVRQAFLHSSLAELPAYKDDWTHDYGVVFFGSPVELLYEDLSVSVGDRCVLDTISHEEMCTFSFTEGELQKLAAFAGKPLAEKIRKKAEEG